VDLKRFGFVQVERPRNLCCVNLIFWKFYFIMALRDEDKHNIPDLIYDVGTNVTYRKGRFFGKVSLSLSVSSWLLCTDFI